MQSVEKPRPAVDIHVRSFEFAVSLVALYKSMDRRGQVARTLGLQLLRSGTSIGANLAEANSGQSKADFVAKCSIALKEAREAHYWLRLLTRSEVVPAAEGRALIAEADQIVAVLTAILKKSRSNPDRG
jgi:four helix bundle protein